MTNKQPLAGVNLGGWLVLEKWMTPSLFSGTDAADEYTYCQQATAADRQRLRVHRDSFITEADFVRLHDHGITAVRLPVGYWLFGDEAPFVATKPYVDQAFRWANRHQIKILLDVHGAPGSQNGRDHSGHSGHIGWDQPKTLAFIRRLAGQYGQEPALLGISVLNEPHPRLGLTKLEQFYRSAYEILDAKLNAGAWIVVDDSFRSRFWHHRLPADQFPRVVIDNHHYQLHTPLDRLLSVRAQLWRVKHIFARRIAAAARYHPTMVGEWTAALKWEKVRHLPASRQDELTKAFIASELQALQPARAWFFWSYKTEAANNWNFRHVVDQGLFDASMD